MRRPIQVILPLIDILLSLLSYPAGFVLRTVRRIGVHRLPLSKKTLLKVGVFPIRDHYYEPLFDPRHLYKPLSADRELPGIDLNVDGQLEYLNKLSYSHEIADISARQPTGEGVFHFNNQAFESGDAEYWYNVIRDKKPKRIVEIGSGYSTLLARWALAANHQEDPAYACKHVCVEPFEQPWLEQLGVDVVRKKVEEVEKDLFGELTRGDFLFIDSSHVIRPQGDVLFEYLEVLPMLSDGVMVHIHDIFTPRDYLEDWIVDRVKLWNEQYLLEAFLTGNKQWKVIGALNYLHHHHYQALSAVCPYLHPDREPGSFYIEKIG